jgi:hypothetical protein
MRWQEVLFGNNETSWILLHGKRDTLERDIFIGGLFSFSPIVIFVI